ncbi:hypothetical protein EMIT079MI2_50038 [Bacillus sp. IT-79MI2]
MTNLTRSVFFQLRSFSLAKKIREWGNYDCPKDNLATKRLFLHIAFCLSPIDNC